MHMQVEYVLSCSFAVLLNNADAIRVGGFFNGYGNSFGNLVDLAELVFWYVEDVNVMLFWYNKRVSNV
jgi:hypothetical protein